MGRFSRSWQLTKLSFRVIGQDKELLLFPLLSGLFSLGYIAALIVPMAVVSGGGPPPADGTVESSGSALSEAAYYAVSFLIYFGLAFVATFFNTCVVYTVKTRFEGGNATFFGSLSFALKRIHLIFSWAMVAATVGMIFRVIENAIEKAGPIGRIIGSILLRLLGMAWGVVTIFVVPAMVYNGLGPIDAIKRSIDVLKRTWGESLIRHYGLGFMFFVLGVLGVLMTVGLAIVIGQQLPWVPLAFGALYFVALICIFNVANTIFNVALYVYADTGSVPAGYDEDVVRGAVGPRR
jgi:hypothetical protein